MKSISALLIVLFSAILVFGQAELESGTFSINGSVSFTSNYEESSEMNSTVFIFNPRFDYFIVNNISLGVMLHYQNISIFDRNNSNWGIGPALRYYLNIEQVKPFFGIGYYHSTENSNFSTDKIKNDNIALNAGADYFITKNVALETLISYTFINTTLPDDYKDYYRNLEIKRKSLSIGVGINVFLR